MAKLGEGRRLTLGDVCQKGSSNIAQKDLVDNEGKYPIYGASGFIKNVDFCHQKKSYIAVVKDGAGIGRTMLLPANSSVIGTMQYLIPKEDVDIDVTYLYYAIDSMNLAKYYSGATIPHIYYKDYQKEPINLPCLAIQREIANIFMKIDQMIEWRNQQLQKLDELVKSRFVEMFGDPISNPKEYKKEKIEKHINLLSGYPFKSEQYVDEGINICGGLIIMPQKIKWEECVHWHSADGFEEYLLEENDIVMALDRPWISDGFKIAKVDSEHLPALLIQRTARIRAIDMNQEYLYYCFINGGFDTHSNVTGSLVPHISAKDIRSFEVMVPPVELQKNFSDYVKQVDKSKLAVQKSLEQLEILKKSLMQAYFG